MRKYATVVALGGICGAVHAQDAEPPDVELLEYLGSWQAEDEDWLVIEWAKDEPPSATERDGRERREPERAKRERERTDDEKGT